METSAQQVQSRLQPSEWEALVTVHRGAFQASFDSLYAGIGGVGRRCDRTHYSLVVLGRLLATLALQRHRWLDQDEWYLHNKFGQSQQQGQDQFFAHFLPMLWFRGLTLPPQERPLAVLQQLGQVPFLPTGPFQPHPLEQQYGHRQIPDGAFEVALEWLGDLAQSLAQHPGLAMTDLLAPLFEQFVNQQGDRPLVTPLPVVQALCDRTLHHVLSQRVHALTGHTAPWTELLTELDPDTARTLLEELPQLAILDPACGSGRYLIAAFQALGQIYAALAARVTQAGQPLPAGLQPGPTGCQALVISRQILKGSFYGVDLSPQAVDLARLQLFLCLVEQGSQPQDLQGLPDVTLNVLQGNALVGLVRVDSERFDQVPSPGSGAVALQGNLLQPLLAEDYRSILTERQIRLEHYRDQTHLLSEVNGIPGYVQAEFLRDRIAELNRTAQGRLNQLLLSEFSQQLGLRYRQSDRQGRPQRRPLTGDDIAALQPFHWGFHVHELLARGGFDLVICHPPWGAWQSTPEGFYRAFQDLFERKGIALEAFRHHRKQLLTLDAELATAWRDYGGQFTYLGDYFRRSEAYRHSAHSLAPQVPMRLYQARLMLERSHQLLRPGGVAAFLLPGNLWHQENAEHLRHWLQQENRILAVVEFSNHQKVLGSLPARTTVSLLWLEKGGTPADYPHLAWTQPATAPTTADLERRLQGLIDLPKQSLQAG